MPQEETPPAAAPERRPVDGPPPIVAPPVSPGSAPPAPSPPPRRRFELAWWAWLPGLAGLAAVLVISSQRPGNRLGMAELAAVIQWIIGVLVCIGIAGLVALIASQATKNSTRVFNFALALVTLIACGFETVWQVQLNSRAAEWQRKLNAIVDLETASMEAQRRFKTEGLTPESVEAVRASVEKIADQTGGVVGATLKAQQPIIRTFQNAGMEFNKALKAFTAAGGIAGKSLTDRAACDERLQLLAAVATAHDRFQTLTGRLHADLRAAVESAGATPELVDSNMRAFESKAAVDDQILAREQTARLLALYRERIEFLRDRLGTWRFDPDKNVVRFDSSEDVKAYRATQALIDEAAAKEAEALKAVKAHSGG